MNRLIKRKYIALSFLFTIFQNFACTQQTPRLAIIFVVDQVAYRTLENIKQYMHGGIKFLLNNGLVYKNAYHPHGMPATATGHTALNTGTYAKDHGIIENSWIDPEGNKVLCDEDSAANAAVFSPSGLYPYGKSGHFIMIDGISDQLILASRPHAPKKVFAISLKSRSAISCAGKLGKAIWFDSKSGHFTSSKAYFDALPDWLKQFNATHKVNTISSVKWNRVYNSLQPYTFAYHHDYSFAAAPKLIDTVVPIGKNYTLFQKTPAATQLTLDAARACIEAHYNRSKDHTLVVWISISSPDKIGHCYGQESLELIDSLYHLDIQIKSFMQWISRKTNNKSVLYALTADHGAGPIPELVKNKGMCHAQRIRYPHVVKDLNTLIEKKFNISNLVYNFKVPAFSIDEKKFNSLKKCDKAHLIREVKKFLLDQKGIKQVWTRDELQKHCYASDDLALFFKNQIYPGRSGYFIIQPFPYALSCKYKYGTAHRTPYEYDTHVPLIIYQRHALEHRTIEEKVLTTQFAPTLAHILGVPRPSACTSEILPGIINECAIGCY